MKIINKNKIKKTLINMNWFTTAGLTLMASLFYTTLYMYETEKAISSNGSEILIYYIVAKDYINLATFLMMITIILSLLGSVTTFYHYYYKFYFKDTLKRYNIKTIK